MRRQAVRDLKMQVRLGSGPNVDINHKQQAREAALALLGRSIRFSHDRLAILRLHAAVCVGAAVPQEHWHYCYELVMSKKNPELQTLFVATLEALKGQTRPN